MTRFGLAALALAPLAAAPAAAQEIEGLRLIGVQTVPRGTIVADTLVGGLSGLAFDAQAGQWLAICDDRSERAPARFYTLALDYDDQAFRSVAVTAMTVLQDEGGQAFANRTVDPEALVRTADGRLFWTSEGDVSAGLDPFIRQTDATGAFVRSLAMPDLFRAGAGGAEGPRNNQVFEGATLSADGATLWVALENALVEDGPRASLAEASPIRITEYDLATGAAGRQVAYVVDPIPVAPAEPGGGADNGASEILALDADTLLVLERGFAVGRGNTIRLFRAELANATDVSSLPALAGAAWAPATKRLLLDFADLGIALDNFEGMAWGPDLANGNRSLVLVSDDNFNDAQQTFFLVFEVVTD